MDRIQEFKEIIEKLTNDTETDESPIVRNRKTPKEVVEVDKVDNFSNSFLNECNMTNFTLLQLSNKLKEISQKSDQINFSFSSNKISSNDKTKEIEEALNICSMNISVMKKKLEDFKEETARITQASQVSRGSFLSKLFHHQHQHLHDHDHLPLILEHCRLVILFLESRIGRLTENLESVKLRKKNREKLLSIQQDAKKEKVTFKSATTVDATITANTTATADATMSMLQVENTRMIEEISRGLFETLSTTETQILEISRLQSTLQSHLSMQHDLTCRLFDDSITTVQDTQKGNEYLKKTGKDSSTMRIFLVALILSMSLLLLLLHYFNK